MKILFLYLFYFYLYLFYYIQHCIWQESTTLANETTGYFKNSDGTPLPIGSYTSDNKKYIVIGSLVKFVPPTGYFFNSSNQLVAGVPVRADEKLVIWASPTSVYLDGTNQGLGNFTNGQGPVTINDYERISIQDMFCRVGS